MKRISTSIFCIVALLLVATFPASAAVTSDPLSWFSKGGETGRGGGFQYNEADGTLYCIADKGGSMMSPDYQTDKGDTMLDSNMLLRTKNGIALPPGKDTEADYYMKDFGWTFDYTTLKNEWNQDRAMFRSRQENEWSCYMLFMVGSEVVDPNRQALKPGLNLYVGGYYDTALAHVKYQFEVGVTYRVKIQMIENVIKVWFYKAGTAMPSEPTMTATIDTAENYIPSGDFQWQSWGGNTVLSNMEIGVPSIVDKADPIPKKLSIPGMTEPPPPVTGETQAPPTPTETEAPAEETTTPAGEISSTVENGTVPSGGAGTTAPSQADATEPGTQQKGSAALPIVLAVCGALLVAGAVAAFFILRNKPLKTDASETTENTEEDKVDETENT